MENNKQAMVAVNIECKICVKNLCSDTQCLSPGEIIMGIHSGKKLC